MRVTWLWLMAAGACGREGFNPLVDAVRDDASTIPDAFAIPTGPFGPAQLLPGINDPGPDDDPTLTGDMLELIFDSERDDPVGDLFSSTRADLASRWSTPVLIAELSMSGFDEDGPCLDADGLSITFSTDAFGGAGRGDLFRSTRTDRASPWSVPVPISELSTAGDDERFCRSDPRLGFVHSDNLRVDNDLYVTSRATDAEPWSAPVPLAINTDQDDQDVAIDASGLVLVFSSTRGGDFDLYMTTRATREDSFGAPVPLAELNTPVIESDPWLSPDFRTIVFTRGTPATRDLYFATR